MSPSAPSRDDPLKAEWLTSTKAHTIELCKVALKTSPRSHAYCFNGVDPEDIYKVTSGKERELDNRLRTIYCQYGPVDLLLRGRDEDGDCYIKCAQPGHKYGPAKAVICVSPAKKKGGTAAAKTEVEQAVVADGEVNIQKDWEELGSEEVEEVVGDEWVEV